MEGSIARKQASNYLWDRGQRLLYGAKLRNDGNDDDEMNLWAKRRQEKKHQRRESKTDSSPNDIVRAGSPTYLRRPCSYNGIGRRESNRKYELGGRGSSTQDWAYPRGAHPALPLGASATVRNCQRSANQKWSTYAQNWLRCQDKVNRMYEKVRWS